MTVYNVQVTVLSTDEATVAQAESVDFPTPFAANGSSKRHPKDADVSEIGFNLAVARALANLAEAYAKLAADAVQGSVEVGGYTYEPETFVEENSPYLASYLEIRNAELRPWEETFYNALDAYSPADAALSLKNITHPYVTK